MQLLDEHITENIVKVGDARLNRPFKFLTILRIRLEANTIGKWLGSHKDLSCRRYCAPSLMEIWNAASLDSAKTTRA